MFENIVKSNDEIDNNTTYVNPDDGLLYCTNCNTPRQQIVPDLPESMLKFFKDYKVPTICKCRSIQAKKLSEEQEKRDKAQLVRVLRRKGIKVPKANEWTFENDNGSTNNMDIAKKYVAEFQEMKKDNCGLFLWGDVGTGKSFFAGCIANELINNGINVCMTNFAIILADMTNFSVSKNQYIQQLNQAELLIIDDFGIERNTSFALEQLYHVIDARYTSNKPLIITTNILLSELQDKTVETQYRRLYDRIIEMCVPVKFAGESKRLKNGEEKFVKIKRFLK